MRSDLSPCLSRLGTAPDGRWAATAINLTTCEQVSWQGDIPMNPASAAKFALGHGGRPLDDPARSDTGLHLPSRSQSGRPAGH